MSESSGTTYFLNAFLPWLPRLRSTEFKVFINLASWTSSNNKAGWTFMGTLARGRRDLQGEAGCNISIRGVRRILHRLKAMKAVEYETSSEGVKFTLLAPPPLSEAHPSLESSKESSKESSHLTRGTLCEDSGDPMGCTGGPQPLHGRTLSKDDGDPIGRTAGTLSSKFTMIPTSMVRGDLDGNALKIYLLLAAHADRRASAYALAKHSGVSKRHVRSVLSQLATRGLARRDLGRWVIAGKGVNLLPPQERPSDIDAAAVRGRVNDLMRGGSGVITDEELRFYRRYAPDETAALEEMLRSQKQQVDDLGKWVKDTLREME